MVHFIFRDNENLRSHVKLMHGYREEAMLCCRPWCDKEFNVLADLIKHREKCLKTCAICMKTFKRQDKFNGHMRAHEIMRKRMCD